MVKAIGLRHRRPGMSGPGSRRLAAARGALGGAACEAAGQAMAPEQASAHAQEGAPAAA